VSFPALKITLYPLLQRSWDRLPANWVSDDNASFPVSWYPEPFRMMSTRAPSYDEKKKEKWLRTNAFIWFTDCDLPTRMPLHAKAGSWLLHLDGSPFLGLWELASTWSVPAGAVYRGKVTNATFLGVRMCLQDFRGLSQLWQRNPISTSAGT